MIADEEPRSDSEIHIDILIIHSVRDAISRARLAWIAGLVVTFALAGGIYNEYCGFTKDIIERRNLAARIVEHDLCEKESEASKAFNIEQGKVTFFILAREGKIPEMENIAAYCRQYDAAVNERNQAIQAAQTAPLATTATPPAQSNKVQAADDKLAELKKNFIDRTEREIDELKKHRMELDTITLPGISIQAGGSDIGILGTIALLIVGIWLSANLLNERDALAQLLCAHKDDSGNWGIHPENAILSKRSLRRAYEAIANTFVFTHVEKKIFPFICLDLLLSSLQLL